MLCTITMLNATKSRILACCTMAQIQTSWDTLIGSSSSIFICQETFYKTFALFFTIQVLTLFKPIRIGFTFFTVQALTLFKPIRVGFIFFTIQDRVYRVGALRMVLAIWPLLTSDLRVLNLFIYFNKTLMLYNF